jgi:hypothetical protein
MSRLRLVAKAGWAVMSSGRGSRSKPVLPRPSPLFTDQFGSHGRVAKITKELEEKLKALGYIN